MGWSVGITGYGLELRRDFKYMQFAFNASEKGRSGTCELQAVESGRKMVTGVFVLKTMKCTV